MTFEKYNLAEEWLIDQIISNPDYITDDTNVVTQVGFCLRDPRYNDNDHSNYEYAEAFFQWMMSGATQLSPELKAMNGWAERFVTSKGLPENFSASYGRKILNQLPAVIHELKHNKHSRRGYITVLQPQDQIILEVKTTHEYPCTIGVQFLFYDNKLHCIVNMRSNNVLKVMPYDVYNFTCLQMHVARVLGYELGTYKHQINHAHMYKGDIRRFLNQ